MKTIKKIHTPSSPVLSAASADFKMEDEVS
jgi:hypothetical protein